MKFEEKAKAFNYDNDYDAAGNGVVAATTAAAETNEYVL